jgi:anti-sigma factor RsiW
MDIETMSNDLHLNDQELLLEADGEFSARRAAKIRAHVAKCQSCRTRRAELERTLLNLQETHRDIQEAQLPSSSSSRALLRARLAEAAAKELRMGSWWRFLQLAPVIQLTAVIGIACLIAVAAMRTLFPHPTSRGAQIVSFDRTAIPNRNLTPGAARTVSLGEVCSMAHEEVERDVPASLRHRVFEEYGIANARADDYEIDYLIAPGLGGTEDIHNLWPEPYTSETWNAHVKDALEEHLHQLVCDGKVDMGTAQKDISTDWIAAYRKYFHTDQPVDQRVVSFPKNFGMPESVVTYGPCDIPVLALSLKSGKVEFPSYRFSARS